PPFPTRRSSDLTIAALPPNVRPPRPNVAVPSLWRSRESLRKTPPELAPPKLSVPLVPIVVVPLPPMTPPGQVSVPLTTRSPAPLSVLPGPLAPRLMILPTVDPFVPVVDSEYVPPGDGQCTR